MEDDDDEPVAGAKAEGKEGGGESGESGAGGPRESR